MRFKIEQLAWQRFMRQSDLARKAGLRYATIHKYWGNDDIRRPDTVVLDKIAKALGVSVDDLILREGEKPQGRIAWLNEQEAKKEEPRVV